MPDVIQIAIEAIDNASKVIGGVGSSLDKLSTDAERSSKNLSAFGMTTEQIGNKMTQVGKIATVGLTLPIAGIAVAATKAASDLNETMNKVDVLFGNQATAIKKWSETSATAFGQSKQHALDSAASFAMFGKSAGLAGDQVVDFAKKHTVLASDLASFNNTSPQEAFEAIGAALRGETEPIRRYNVLINEATLKDEALRQGLIKTTSEALTPQQKILATSALIFKQTTAAQGDYARTAGGVANATRTLNEQFQDMLSSLGQTLLPTVQNAVGVANDLLKSFNALDQPTKDLVVGFGLMAAAAGPVLTIGGQVVKTFGSLTSTFVDVAHGVIGVSKTIGETAGYLKEAGISADSLKFAFQNLKAGGAVLGAELGVIAAGLVIIAKYIEQVGVASKASSEDLIAMSKSGDFFKQAAAASEIYWHGQERIKTALDGTRDSIIKSSKDYADYKSSLEATAKAAGYQVDEQGNLVKVIQLVDGVQTRLIQSNYEMTASEYAVNDALHAKGGLLDQGLQKLLGLSHEVEVYTAKQRESDTSIVKGTREQIDGLRALAEARTRTGDAEKEYQLVVKETLDAIKAQNGIIADTTALAITYTDSQRKQNDVQAELDKLNATIAARGPAHTAVIRDQKVSTEDLTTAQLKLTVAQEDLATAQKKKGETDAEFALRIDTIKGKIADYSGKLGEHTVIVGGATKAEQEQKKALEEQIATLQKADEVSKARGAFDALTAAFRAGTITQDQYTVRAAALNSITHLYTDSALASATAQETLMKSFADPNSEAWRSQLILNQKAIDGNVESTAVLTGETNTLIGKQAEAAKAIKATRAETKAEDVTLGGPKISASVAAAQAHLNFINANQASAASAKAAIEEVSVAQEKSSREMKGNADVIAGGYNSVNNAIADTQARNATMTNEAIANAQARSSAQEKESREMKGNVDQVAGAYNAIPKEVSVKVKTIVEDVQAVAGDSFRERLKQLPSAVTTKVGVDTTQATKDYQKFTSDLLNNVPKSKTTTIQTDTVSATKNTNDILLLYSKIPPIVNNRINVEAEEAEKTLASVLKGINDLYNKVVTITVKYVTQGSPPAGLARGGSYIVPPNSTGATGDYFPVLAAPGERVTVETKSQQNSGKSSVAPSGDTYIYNTNISNPLAAKMFTEEQRRKQLARSNARMGVA